jgi:hypothetical protein
MQALDADLHHFHGYLPLAFFHTLTSFSKSTKS